MRLLLDSNIVIYGTRRDDVVVSSFIESHELYVSAITFVESLGFPRIGALEIASLRRTLEGCTVVYPDAAIIEGAIALRQQRKISLGDSLIAATARVHSLTLCTRNTSDFDWIASLHIVNPYTD